MMVRKWIFEDTDDDNDGVHDSKDIVPRRVRLGI